MDLNETIRDLVEETERRFGRAWRTNNEADLNAAYACEAELDRKRDEREKRNAN